MKTAARRALLIGCAIAALVAGPVGCDASRRAVIPELPAIARNPVTPEQQARIDSAEAATDAGDLDRALVLFQTVLAENPTITTAYLGIGDIYVLKQEFDRAEPAFRRAARIEPRNFDAQYGHGVALQMLQRFVDAVRAYSRALVIDPDSSKANLNLATTYLQMDDAQRAVRFAERAVELEPDNGPARVNLGAVYEKVGRHDDAVEAYLAALELMGNRPPLMMNLINAQAKVKRYFEAMNTAETLVRIEPSAAAYERLGWCAFKLREYDRSIEAYRAAVEIDPGYWPALNGVGVNALNRWLVSKKTDGAARREAGDVFRRSLRANPDQRKVVELLLNYSL